MLILRRRLEETVLIGDNIEVRVVSIQGGFVELGFTAPADVRVDREEYRAALPPASPRPGRAGKS